MRSWQNVSASTDPANSGMNDDDSKETANYTGGMLQKVAMLLPGPIAPFEAGTVCEVFGIDRSAEGIPGFDFRICGPVAGEPLPATTGGLQMIPPRGLDGLVGADLVVVSATPDRAFAPEIIAAVRDAWEAGATVLSICSGAILLGEAGMLDDRQIGRAHV